MDGARAGLGSDASDAREGRLVVSVAIKAERDAVSSDHRLVWDCSCRAEHGDDLPHKRHHLLFRTKTVHAIAHPGCSVRLLLPLTAREMNRSRLSGFLENCVEELVDGDGDDVPADVPCYDFFMVWVHVIEHGLPVDVLQGLSVMDVERLHDDDAVKVRPAHVFGGGHAIS